jgi:hypothetical protein
MIFGTIYRSMDGPLQFETSVRQAASQKARSIVTGLRQEVPEAGDFRFERIFLEALDLTRHDRLTSDLFPQLYQESAECGRGGRQASEAR